MHSDAAIIKIKIFNPQTQAFINAQTCTIQQRKNNLVASIGDAANLLI